MLSLGRVQGTSKMNLAGSLTRQVSAMSVLRINVQGYRCSLLSSLLLEQERLCRQGQLFACV
jgi:hypothetical protein